MLVDFVLSLSGNKFVTTGHMRINPRTAFNLADPKKLMCLWEYAIVHCCTMCTYIISLIWYAGGIIEGDMDI